MGYVACRVSVCCQQNYSTKNVYFYPIIVNGEVYVDINSFNGCDDTWNKCPACETCKHLAYKKLMESND